MTVPDLGYFDARLRSGDDAVLGEAFALLQQRLLQTVRLRMDRRMLGRVEPDDIVQETFLVASRRLDEYRGGSHGSLFLWLRTLTLQVLVDASRFHLHALRRSSTREISLPIDASASVIGSLADPRTSPTGAASRHELSRKLQEEIDRLPELDREILLLRHFEELTNGEVAELLGIHKAAATNRYLRALRRLRHIIAGRPESWGQTGT